MARLSTRRGDGRSRILIEGFNLTLPQGTGVATYARGLAGAARAAGYDCEVLVSSNRRISRRDPELGEVSLFDTRHDSDWRHLAGLALCHVFGAPFGIRPGVLHGLKGLVVPPSDALAGFARIHAVPRLIDVERMHFMRHGHCLRLKVDDAPQLFHATRPAALRVDGAACLYTIHDIVPLRLPYATADDKAFHIAMVRELARTADHIVTVSEFSRQDIIAFTGIAPERITNTYQVVEFPPEMLARSVEEVATSLRDRHGLDYKNYYLFVGAIEPKKNVSRLIEGYAASRVSRPLIIAGGPGWMNEEDLKRIADERFLSYTMEGKRILPQRAVRRLSYVARRDLVDLMRGARALLCPSIYEGFGLPAAEAMLVGTPVLTSNITSLPEITAGNAVLVDPYEVDAIAKGIRTLDADNDLAAELARKGPAVAERYSARHFAQRMTKLYSAYM